MEYTSKDATHSLSCKHCYGKSTFYYAMPCLILKDMPDGNRLKVLVFGERWFKDRVEKQSVRYVSQFRVKGIEE